MATKSILSLSQSAERRLWFFIDELPSLHRLPRLVNDSEFIQLDDLEAYLRLPGDWPVSKVKFEIKQNENENLVFFPFDDNDEVEKIEPISESLPMQSFDEIEKPKKKIGKIKRDKINTLIS